MELSNGTFAIFLRQSSFACSTPVRRTSGKKLFNADYFPGSQIILYFVGGSLQFVTADLKAPATAVWLPVANTLAIAAIAPYTGYLQDLFGKRYIALFGAVLICVGIVLVGTAHGFAQGVAGMAMAGAGAGIGELTGLAG